jgi:probable phosphoglycerate mutase
MQQQGAVESPAMPATQFIAIRHGETEWNLKGRFQGHMDSPLSTLGRAQAAALGRRVATERFDVLYSSDLGRAVETAGEIARCSGHAVKTDPQLRERNFGILEGLTEAEIIAAHGDTLERLRRPEPDFRIPGGESLRQAYERCVAAFTGLAKLHAGGTVVVVCHGGVLAHLYQHATASPMDTPRKFAVLNASVNRFVYDGDRWELLQWGDVSHLDDIEDTTAGAN